MDSEEIERKKRNSQIFGPTEALNALLRRPGKRHCILCWEHAITNRKPDDERGRDEQLGDIVDLITTGNLGSGFGADNILGCEYPYHDDVVKNGKTEIRYSVWAKENK